MLRRILTVFLLSSAGLLAQALPPPGPAPLPGGVTASSGPRLGFGFNTSSLGLGLEGALRLTDSTNLRVGFNDFNYGHSYNHDGVDYAGRLDLRSVHASFDWFFWGSLHLSPGVMLYNGNRVTAGATVPSGQQFTLGGTTYTSGSANPVSGSGLLSLNKAGPMLTLGFGNLVPRGLSRFSAGFELGAAYQGAPAVALNLNGTVCDSTGTTCAPASSFPGFSGSVQQEQLRLQNILRVFKVYPILSVGFGYSF